MSNKLLEAAIKYATEYGWAVFPCSSTSKKPLTPHGCKDAKKNVGAIKAWWKKWPDASIGVATGTASNLIVIDEDLDDIYLDEFNDEIDQWVIDAFKAAGLDTAKEVLAISKEDLIKRTDLEEETIEDVIRILEAEFAND